MHLREVYIKVLCIQDGEFVAIYYIRLGLIYHFYKR
jgi:hypothetical protein